MRQWIPKKSNDTARNMILLLFCGAFALLALTAIWGDIPFRWGFQTIALLLLTAAIFFVTRYMTKMFVYRVEADEDGDIDLTVTEAAANGKRAVTVCRVGVRSVCSARLFDFSDGEASLSAWKEFKKGRKKIHDYRVDLRPVTFLLVSVKEGGETLYILLSHEVELTELLTSAAKAYREEDEE